MDVNAPKEILKETCEDEDIFEMDDVKSVKTIKTAFTEVNRNSLGVALDVCLDMLLDHVVRECQGADGELDWDKTKKVYHNMITVFDKVCTLVFLFICADEMYGL